MPTSGAESSADEYGAPSRKRRRAAPADGTSDVRVSSRGVKIPNYADDGGFRSDEYMEEDATPAGHNGAAAPMAWTPDGQPLYEEQDEIDGVFGHARDDEHRKCCLASTHS